MDGDCCNQGSIGNYVGVKVVKAVPMTVNEYNEKVRPLVYSGDDKSGYKVTYQDGYEAWSPKAVFEKAYLRIGYDNKINEHNVNDFIVKYETRKWGDKTTIVVATLANGFVVCESSSCIDPANYNEDIGYNICKEKIQNKVWEMLGFLLQCGVNGIK